MYRASAQPGHAHATVALVVEVGFSDAVRAGVPRQFNLAEFRRTGVALADMDVLDQVAVQRGADGVNFRESQHSPSVYAPATPSDCSRRALNFCREWHRVPAHGGAVSTRAAAGGLCTADTRQRLLRTAAGGAPGQRSQGEQTDGQLPAVCSGAPPWWMVRLARSTSNRRRGWAARSDSGPTRRWPGRTPAAPAPAGASPPEPRRVESHFEPGAQAFLHSLRTWARSSQGYG